MSSTKWSRIAPAPGQTAERSRLVEQSDIERFTAISGDRNPIHYDERSAARTPFGRIVVQGGITTAILNAVVAEDLPGPGTVFLNTNLNFTAPVHPGDTITGRIEIMSVRQDKPICELKATVTRQDGVTVVEGSAVSYTFDVA